MDRNAAPAPMKVICCLPPGPLPEAIVPPLPAHWERRNVAKPADIDDAIAAGADAMLLAVHSPMERKTLERLRGIKLLQWVGVGLDTIDLDAARELGIPVANVVAANSVAVAEYAILATMYLVRRFGDVMQLAHAEQDALAGRGRARHAPGARQEHGHPFVRRHRPRDRQGRSRAGDEAHDREHSGPRAQARRRTSSSSASSAWASIR